MSIFSPSNMQLVILNCNNRYLTEPTNYKRKENERTSRERGQKERKKTSVTCCFHSSINSSIFFLKVKIINYIFYVELFLLYTPAQ